ncbi:MAG: hypothetical protein IKG25_10790 [Mogibacterium sp.]|nr:hypothetical protein [Mogibacterium sp.]
MVPGTSKDLTATPPIRKLETKNGRVVCPICKRLLNISVRPQTTADHLPVWCRRCEWQGQVKITDGVCFVVSPNR